MILPNKLFKNLKYIFSRDKINKKDIYLVDPLKDKNFLIDSLNEEDILAVDTEFDWRNTYFPKLSLLQIASKSRILLIDCLQSGSLHFLKKLLENEKKLIIMHSSRSDTTVLYTNLNIKVKNIFDIQIAEKYISNGDLKNYATIVNKYFRINLKKTETNSNWLNRPLSEEQLNYAAEDVNYLIEIYKKQKKILKKINFLEKVYKKSIRESRLGHQDLHVSRMKKLNRPSKVEKNIFLWREKYAENLNIPTSYVFKNKDLKKIAYLIEEKNEGRNELMKYFKTSLYLKEFFDYLKDR